MVRISEFLFSVPLDDISLSLNWAEVMRGMVAEMLPLKGKLKLGNMGEDGTEGASRECFACEGGTLS
jgi:hypothetical protein